jgi:hypothetical protein
MIAESGAGDNGVYFWPRSGGIGSKAGAAVVRGGEKGDSCHLHVKPRRGGSHRRHARGGACLAAHQRGAEARQLVAERLVLVLGWAVGVGLGVVVEGGG